jgi:hypothetical protein
MLIKFNTNHSYGNIEFIKGNVYDLQKEGNFAQRWIKRGCTELSAYEGEILPDPRFPVKAEVVDGDLELLSSVVSALEAIESEALLFGAEADKPIAKTQKKTQNSKKKI